MLLIMLPVIAVNLFIPATNAYAANKVNSSIHQQVHEFRLQNGLKLLVKPDSRYPLAMVQIWYGVGSGMETAAQNGISHLLEHMMFKPTQADPFGTIYQELNRVGAQGNAFTSHDYSFYYHFLAKQHLELSFQLESQRMQGVIFTPEDLIHEKQIVAEEQATRLADDPYLAGYDALYRLAFGTHPYALPIIGRRQSQNSITYTQLKNWYSDYYRPENAILVVMGDVLPEPIFQLTQKYFSKLSNPPLQTKTQAKPSILPKPPLQQTLASPVKVGMLLQGYHVPGIKTAHPQWQAYALELLAAWWDSGINSHLTRALVQEQRVADQVRVIYSPLWAENSLFIIEALPAAGVSLKQLEQYLNRELQRIGNELLSDIPLQRVKNQIRATAVFEQDSLFTQAKILGQAEVIGLPWWEDALYLERIDSISAEQLQRVMQKFIRPELKFTLMQQHKSKH